MGVFAYIPATCAGVIACATSPSVRLLHCKSRTDNLCQHPRKLNHSNSGRQAVPLSTMDRFLYLWSVFLFASTALSLGIIKPITISTSPTSNLTVLQFPTLPATNLSSTSDNARCFKGSFSIFRRIHFGDCRTAIGTLPPNNPRVPLYPVEKSYM